MDLRWQKCHLLFILPTKNTLCLYILVIKETNFKNISFNKDLDSFICGSFSNLNFLNEIQNELRRGNNNFYRNLSDEYYRYLAGLKFLFSLLE